VKKGCSKHMKLPIMMYHSVSDQASPKFRRWVIPPTRFDRHLAYLKEKGYSVLTATEIAKAVKDPSISLPERVVSITFDDGFEDFYYHALPLLQRYGFLATLYVTSGYVGETSEWLASEGEDCRPMLNWKQIREIADSGIEIGAHSLHHYELDTLDIDHAKYEISASKTLLEQYLEREIHTFAFPHGYHNREVRALVEQAGFSSACAVKNGMSSRDDDPYALARIIVPGDTSVYTFAGLLKGKGLKPVTAHERTATTVWRLVRRAMKQVNSTLPWISDTKGGNPNYGKRPNRS
jgi:peptidoglycan/xylan/chitin deacetylase (PgdA/CDA1 family)